MWRTTFSKILDRNGRLEMGGWFYKKKEKKRRRRRRYLSIDVFFDRFDDSSLQITWYNASGKRCVDDVRDDDV